MPEQEPKKSRLSFDKLDKLRKSLYKRETPSAAFSEKQDLPGGIQSQDSIGASTDWRNEPEIPSRMSKVFTIQKSVMKKIIWGAVAFFVLSLSIGVFIFFGGINNISTNNVSISVSGPSSIGAGEPLSFELSIANQNNVDLEDATLLIEYPPGTHTADAEEKDFPRESESLGNIAAGTVVTRSKRALLFGEANTVEHIQISVEYRVKDSSATYFKEESYDVVISSSPVSMKVDAVKEAVSGHEIDFSIEVVSNSASVVSGLMLKADYPFGFTFSAASPAPTYSNNIFLLGDLRPADRRVIHIRGTLEGQEGEDRNFRFNLGLPSKQDAKVIGTVFLTNSQVIALKKPFVSVALTLDGSSADPFAMPAGQATRAQIAWANNLPSRIADLEIQAKLSGDTLNRQAVDTSDGFYRSVDNVVLWDKSVSDQFAVIEPGESGVVSFTFASLPVSSLIYSGTRGNELSVDVSVRARRLSDANVPEEIVSGASRKIRLSSNLALTGRSLYYTGPFSNQGPIPPKADQNTTYTIVWSVTNTLNDVSGAEVQAELPGYITWLGNVSPSGEVTFDPSSRQVTWDAGDIRAGSGFSTPPREVSFQVSFVPSLSQHGQTPNLLGDSTIIATDRFSGAQIKASARPVTTRIEDGGNQGGSVGEVQQ